VLIDATDALAGRDLNFYEPFVTPMLSPRVLHDPVRNAFFVIESPLIFVCAAAVPPLVYGALAWLRLRLWLRIRLRLRLNVFIFVFVLVIIFVVVLVFVAQVIADDGDCVIQFIATAHALSHDASFNLAEVSTGRDSSVHWPLGHQGNHLVHRVLDSRIGFDSADDIVKLMVASTELLGFVRIVFFSHGAVLFQECVVFIHDAALAAPAFVVLVASGRVFKFPFVVAPAFAFSECAVDSLLLRDAEGFFLGINGEGAFKCRSDCKSPACTAPALILDRRHFLGSKRVIFGCPVHIVRDVIKSPAVRVHGQAHSVRIHIFAEAHIIFFLCLRHG